MATLSYSPTESTFSNGTNRVKVSGLASSTTEPSIREFFSFCGDVKVLHLYPSSLNPDEQEAAILFESEAGASTAILLDNAVVDGNRIRVEMFPQTSQSPTGSTGRRSPAGSTSSKKSMWSDIVSESKSVASGISKSAKEADEKYEITGRVKEAASTVAAVTVSTAKTVDEKFNVSENAAAAWSATKDGVTSLDNKLGVSSAIYSMFGWDKQKSPSPRPNSKSPTPQFPKETQE